MAQPSGFKLCFVNEESVDFHAGSLSRLDALSYIASRPRSSDRPRMAITLALCRIERVGVHARQSPLTLGPECLA
jgi:hypothetical protein